MKNIFKLLALLSILLTWCEAQITATIKLADNSLQENLLKIPRGGNYLTTVRFVDAAGQRQLLEAGATIEWKFFTPDGTEITDIPVSAMWVIETGSNSYKGSINTSGPVGGHLDYTTLQAEIRWTVPTGPVTAKTPKFAVQFGDFGNTVLQPPTILATVTPSAPATSAENVALAAPLSGTVQSELQELREMADTNQPYVIVLAIGQSNMQRGGFSTYGQGSYDISTDSRLQILESTGIFSTYDLKIPGQSSGIGSAGSSAENTSTIPYHFGKELARKTGAHVRVVASSKGGQSLDHWGVNTEGTSLNPSAEGWSLILSQIDYVPRIDVVLYHQGETLGGRTRAQQLAGLKFLFENLRSTGKVTADTPIIAGELVNTGQAGNLALRDLDADPAWPQFKLVEKPEGQPLPDNLHFTADQIVDFGHRYASALLGSAQAAPLTEGGELLLRDRSAFPAPQTKIRMGLTCTSGSNYRDRYRVSLQQRQLAANNIADFEIVVHNSSNGDVWNYYIIGGNSSDEFGANIELLNQTSTAADLIIHFVKPNNGSSWWGASVVRVPDLTGDQTANSANTLNFDVTATTEAEPDSIYKFGGSATNHLRASPVNFVKVGSRLSQGTSQLYKKYSLTVTEPAGQEYISHFQFQGRALETTAKMRAVIANIYVARWSGSPVRNLGVTGTKIAGLGVKVELVNETTTTYELVVHFVYDQSQPTYSWAAQFALFDSPDPNNGSAFSDYLAGSLTATATQTPENDIQYHPGGTATSDF